MDSNDDLQPPGGWSTFDDIVLREFEEGMDPYDSRSGWDFDMGNSFGSYGAGKEARVVGNDCVSESIMTSGKGVDNGSHSSNTKPDSTVSTMPTEKKQEDEGLGHYFGSSYMFYDTEGRSAPDSGHYALRDVGTMGSEDFFNEDENEGKRTFMRCWDPEMKENKTGRSYSSRNEQSGKDFQSMAAETQQWLATSPCRTMPGMTSTGLSGIVKEVKVESVTEVVEETSTRHLESSHSSALDSAQKMCTVDAGGWSMSAPMYSGPAMGTDHGNQLDGVSEQQSVDAATAARSVRARRMLTSQTKNRLRRENSAKLKATSSAHSPAVSAQSPSSQSQMNSFESISSPGSKSSQRSSPSPNPSPIPSPGQKAVLNPNPGSNPVSGTHAWQSSLQSMPPAVAASPRFHSRQYRPPGFSNLSRQGGNFASNPAVAMAMSASAHVAQPNQSGMVLSSAPPIASVGFVQSQQVGFSFHDGVMQDMRTVMMPPPHPRPPLRMQQQPWSGMDTAAATLAAMTAGDKGPIPSSYGLASPMTPQEKIEKLRYRQQMRMVAEQQRQLHVRQVLEQQKLMMAAVNREQEQGHLSNVFGLHAAMPPEAAGAGLSGGWAGGQHSLNAETTVMNQLVATMNTLEPDTRLCVRDALYRLAYSSMKRKATESSLQGSGNSSADTGSASLSSGRKREKNWQKSESGYSIHYPDGGGKIPTSQRISSYIEADTNPIDRNIARLLFCRRQPQNQAPRPQVQPQPHPQLQSHLPQPTYAPSPSISQSNPQPPPVTTPQGLHQQYSHLPMTQPSAHPLPAMPRLNTPMPMADTGWTWSNPQGNSWLNNASNVQSAPMAPRYAPTHPIPTTPHFYPTTGALPMTHLTHPSYMSSIPLVRPSGPSWPSMLPVVKPISVRPSGSAAKGGGRGRKSGGKATPRTPKNQVTASPLPATVPVISPMAEKQGSQTQTVAVGGSSAAVKESQESESSGQRQVDEEYSNMSSWQVTSDNSGGVGEEWMDMFDRGDGHGAVTAGDCGRPDQVNTANLEGSKGNDCQYAD